MSESVTRRWATRLESSSEEIAWLTGSKAVGPGRISSIVVSDSPLAAGDWPKETYWFERGVLVAGGGLDRGDDLAGDAELGEVAEAGLAIGPEVPDRLVETDQSLLNQVVGVAADQEVGEALSRTKPW